MNRVISVILLPLALSTPIELRSNSHLNNKASDNVPLVTFDGAEGTTFKFHVLNDPVMVRNRNV